jgi:large subunit ribosomal protein L15
MTSSLSNLKPAPGSTKQRKRVGRGPGSGHGKTSTRGHNGQHSRSGAKFRAWFEGGQMPLQRRIPKVGFKSPFKVQYQVVNLSDLEKLHKDGRLTDTEVGPDVLVKTGMVRKKNPVKVLGNGSITVALKVSAHAFSKSAQEKITAAGGTFTIVNKL